MAYTYLLKLYQVLNTRKIAISKPLAESDCNTEAEQYRQGQLDIIEEFSHFLKENFHAKLPRRIQ